MGKPKSTVKYGLSTATEFLEFELTIRVSTDFKFFYNSAELPEQLREQVHGARQYFDSFYELNSQVESLIAEAEISLIEESKTKVILYSLTTDEGRIDFRWRVCQKVTLTSKRSSSVRYYDERSYRGHSAGRMMDEMSTHAFDGDPLEMPWTLEREAWFRSMGEAIEKLIRVLKSGLCKSPEILARRIDQGAQPLLGGGSDGRN